MRVDDTEIAAGNLDRSDRFYSDGDNTFTHAVIPDPNGVPIKPAQG